MDGGGRSEATAPGATQAGRGGEGAVVDLALLAVVLMWASTFTLFKLAWRTLDPVAFTAVRFGVMLPFSAAVLLSAGRRTLRRRDVPWVVASGVTGYFLYQMGFVLGLDRTSAVVSAVLIATHPVFSLLFMWLLGRDRPRAMEVAGVLLAFVGVSVFLRFWEAFAAARPGDLLSLGAAASFGAYGVVSRPVTLRYPSREVMAYTLGIGGLLLTLVGIPAALRQDWTAVPATTWLILAYAVVGPVYVAYAVWNWAIRRRGIPRTVVFGFLTPIVAAALAVAALGEQVRPEQVVGAVLVVAGLALTRLQLGTGPAPPAGRPLLEDMA